MLQIIILLSAFITFVLIYKMLMDFFFREKLLLGSRLSSISRRRGKSDDGELSSPLFSRLAKPLFDNISSSIMKITPKEIISDFEKKVIMAGSPYKMTVKDWINIQALAVLSLPLVTITTGYYLNSESRNIFLFCILEIGLGVLLPNIILSSRAADRKKKIVNSLPDVIDLLTVSVEAGLGFDAALAKVIDKMPGPVADEFGIVLQEIKVGKQKRDALKGMVDRVNVPDLGGFVTSIIQADQFGVGVGNVLRIQSEQMRQNRRQRAQEKAMKAPVKMLIPMVLFIFPTIFSVLLGPIGIRLYETFMK